MIVRGLLSTANWTWTYPSFLYTATGEISRLRPDSPSEVGTPLEMTSLLRKYVMPSPVEASRAPATGLGCFSLRVLRNNVVYSRLRWIAPENWEMSCELDTTNWSKRFAWQRKTPTADLNLIRGFTVWHYPHYYDARAACTWWRTIQGEVTRQ